MCKNHSSLIVQCLYLPLVNSVGSQHQCHGFVCVCMCVREKEREQYCTCTRAEYFVLKSSFILASFTYRTLHTYYTTIHYYSTMYPHVFFHPIDVTAILFIVACSSYNLFLREDQTKVRPVLYFSFSQTTI